MQPKKTDQKLMQIDMPDLLGNGITTKSLYFRLDQGEDHSLYIYPYGNLTLDDDTNPDFVNLTLELYDTQYWKHKTSMLYQPSVKANEAET